MDNGTLGAITSETLADQAYRSVRTAIVTGEFRPGQKVTERGLAEQLSVSPTPIREAIRRLEQDGLLERTGPRTVKVSLIGETALKDLAEVEIALRGMVARFAARHATEEQLDTLDAILDAADDLVILAQQRIEQGLDAARHLDQLLTTIERFNDAVDACAANPLLIRFLDQTRLFSRRESRERRLERLTKDPEFGLERYALHRALVHALRNRDSAEAERIVVQDATGGLNALLASPAGTASARVSPAEG